MNNFLENTLDSMFEIDEVECVMIASGEELEETAVDSEVKDAEEDDDDDYYDETIEKIGATFTIEDFVVNEFRETRDTGMDLLNEDLIDNFMMDIDPDVEEIEDDDEDEEEF